jgi:hypothetical protein
MEERRICGKYHTDCLASIFAHTYYLGNQQSSLIWGSRKLYIYSRLSSRHHHHHHHPANMDLGHLLTRSVPTHLEFSFIVSPGFFCLLWSSPVIFLCHLLRDILFIRCNQFILYSCILTKTAVIFSFFVSFPSRFLIIICPASSCETCQ